MNNIDNTPPTTYLRRKANGVLYKTEDCKTFTNLTTGAIVSLHPDSLHIHFTIPILTNQFAAKSEQFVRLIEMGFITENQTI